MSAQRVLFIGGTGVISTACSHLAVQRGFDVTLLNRGTTGLRPVAEGARVLTSDVRDAEAVREALGDSEFDVVIDFLAVERGFDVTLLNRGATGLRPVAEGARVLTADVRDAEAVREALGDSEFDVVIDFLAFTPDHVQADIDRFAGRIGQYVFISSASAYQKPPARWPVLESTPLRNPFWQYSRDKIACEDLLTAAYRESGFPVTIVRPSQTYDHTSVPLDGKWTAMARMRRGAPIVVHGDGTSLWTLTHHTDFAGAFVGLLANPHVVGDAFTITSDEALPWDQITGLLAAAAGVEPRIVHVPSDAIAAADPDWGAGLLGDKAHSMVFDNSKIKSTVPGWTATVPFAQGAREIVEWYDADPARQVVDPGLDATIDRLVAAYAPREL